MEKVLILFALLLFLGLLAYWQVSHNKQSIRVYLRDKGASNVVIRWDWGWYIGDQSNHAFHVEYTDLRGANRKTHCKVNKFGGKIYWSEPLEV